MRTPVHLSRPYYKPQNFTHSLTLTCQRRMKFCRSTSAFEHNPPAPHVSLQEITSFYKQHHGLIQHFTFRTLNYYQQGQCLLQSTTGKQRDRKAYSLISPRTTLNSCPLLSAIFLCSDIYMEYRYMIHFTSVAPENLRDFFYLSPVFTVPFLPLFTLL